MNGDYLNYLLNHEKYFKEKYYHLPILEEKNLDDFPLKFLGVENFKLMIDEAIFNFNYHKAYDVFLDASCCDDGVMKRIFPRITSFRDLKKELIKFMYEFEEAVIFGGNNHNFENEYFRVEWDCYTDSEELYVPCFNVVIKYKEIINEHFSKFSDRAPSIVHHHAYSYPSEITDVISKSILKNTKHSGIKPVDSSKM